MVNCDSLHDETQTNKEIIVNNVNRPFKIMVIDTCEYLIFDFGLNSAVMSHKGNCKFCLKRK